MIRVSIIGATTWGNTLASLIAVNGADVRVWAKSGEQVESLGKNRMVKRQHDEGRVEFTADPDLAAEGCDVAIFAVPAQAVRRTARIFSSRLNESTVLVSAAKGLEANTGKRMTEILAEEAGSCVRDKLAVISGPNLSKEINMGLPAVTVIASVHDGIADEVRNLLTSENFTVYPSEDVKGVELCGALKNVIALGAGMVDGLRLGSNAKAALVTVGWNEAMKLGKKLGARESTFYGFAGLGDLVTTCISPLSRNYHTGYELAGGKPLSAVLHEMSNVVEGVDTAKATHILAAKLGLDLPLMEAIYMALSGQEMPEGIARHFLYGHKPG